MVKVLVVEDSLVVREFLVHILSRDPEIQVLAAVSNGEEALTSVQDRKPDVITMDIHMPKMDGLQATRRIMETHPTPIVIVSGSSTVNEATMAFHAMEAGALAVELHTGAYANAGRKRRRIELARLRKAAREARRLGLRVHAGHGLDYENVSKAADLPSLAELNIGHAIVARSVFVGMRRAVHEMRRRISDARSRD